MRPLDRGPAPDSYSDYHHAKQDLVNRFGSYCSYCSYCERRIATGLVPNASLTKPPAQVF